MDRFETLRNSVDESRLAKHLEWFSQVRRDTGGPGETAAAEYIADTLRQDGIEVTMHRFPAFLSYPREASVKTTDINGNTGDFEAVTHSFAVSTPAGGLKGNLKHHDGEDFSGEAGNILLIDGLCTPITVLKASQAGVAALIFVNQGDYVHNMIATTIWGTPSMDQLDRLPTVSVASVGAASGNEIKNQLALGPVEVLLETRVETGWYESILPEVRIEGTGPEKDDFVLVAAHYCSWEYGLTDNATGDACVLEMARVLHQNRDQLKRSVRLAWWPGHSHGRYSGSTWYADTFFEDLSKNCITYHNIDSPGVKNATTYVARHTTAEIQDFCVNLIEGMTGQSNPPVHRPSRAADQSFLANGVPAFSTYPFLPEGHDDRKAWTGGSANAWWWHTKYDTLDKVDTGILKLDTQISLTGVGMLCNENILPLRPQGVVTELQTALEELVEVVGIHADMERTLGKVEQLARAAEAYTGKIESAGQNQSGAAAKVNATLKNFSRIMGNVMYAAGGRFSHDAADMSPIMRNTKSSILPGLRDGYLLNDLFGTDDFGFAKSGFMRQVNRLNDAIDTATELLSKE